MSLLIEDWIQSQKAALGYIWFHGEVSSFHKAMGRLKTDYFDETHKVLWKLLVKYHQETRGVLNTTRLREYLRDKKVSEERVFKLEELLDSCRASVHDMDEPGFEWTVGRLVELYNRVRFVNVMENSHGLMEEKGYKDARDNVLKELSSLEMGGLDIAPEGLLSDDAQAFVDEVSGAKDRRAAQCTDFGLQAIDAEVLGLQSGDTALLAGWTSVGKTTLALNVALHASVIQKRNVVMVTTETSRLQLRRRIFSRLSKFTQFETPIPSKVLKSGILTEAQRETLLAMKKFLREEKNGALMITQAPALATMSWLAGRLLQYESMFKIDLLILDDIRNMTPDVRRSKDYEEISSLLRSMKTIARSHAGRGIPIISPYHMSREAYKEACEHGGRYSLRGLSSSSEAEKINDIIISMWQIPETFDIDIKFLKIRDGSTDMSCRLRADFAHQYLYEVNASSDMDLDSGD